MRRSRSTSLSDDVLGTLAGDLDCQVGTVLGAGASCTFDVTTTIDPGDFGDSVDNIFTAHASDDENNDASDTEDATVTFSDELPTITVDKTVDPGSVPETSGGDVTYTYTVTNDSDEAVTITSLSDDVLGTLAGDLDCQVGTVLGAGASCTFDVTTTIDPGDFGDSVDNIFTAHASDDENNDASDTEDATVTFSDELPTITVDKTVDPGSVPETSGGDVTYTYTVTNDSDEAVTITSLSDDVLGTLAGDLDCQVGTVLGAGASCTFDVTTTIDPGDFGDSVDNIFTAHASDDENNDASDTEDATVTFSDELPTITVDKTVDPGSVPETSGGDVTYTYTVTNDSDEAVTITSLSDDVLGTLAGDLDCQVGTVLGAGASCTFDVTTTIDPGDFGDSVDNIFTAHASDDENNDASDTEDATVTFSDELPTITVDKTVDPGSVPETSGGDVTYTYTVTNDSDEAVTITRCPMTCSARSPATWTARWARCWARVPRAPSTSPPRSTPVTSATAWTTSSPPTPPTTRTTTPPTPRTPPSPSPTSCRRSRSTRPWTRARSRRPPVATSPTPTR